LLNSRKQTLERTGIQTSFEGLVAGRHHPEEHDWNGQSTSAKKPKAKAAATKRRANRKGATRH